MVVGVIDKDNEAYVVDEDDIADEPDEPDDADVPAILPHQALHTARLADILDNRWRAAVDSSPVGAGKTYSACRYAYERGLSVMIVAPKSVKTKWESVAALYGVPCVGAYTYQGLRGTRRHQPNVPHIRRDGDAFAPTPLFAETVNAGVLLVFDEFHNVKNPGTAQVEAAVALVRHVFAQPAANPSRVLLLSATPGDKEVHAFQFARMLGVSAQAELHTYDHRRRVLVLLGLNDLLLWGAEHAWEATADVRTELGVPYNAKASRRLAYQLFVRAVLPLVASAMPAPPLLGADGEPLDPDYRNGFFRMRRANRARLEQGVEMLRRAARPIIEGRAPPANTMGRITRALMVIEDSKKDLFVRLAREQLAADPCAHVVVLLNYLVNVEYVARELHEFAPIKFVGALGTDERDRLLAEFAAPDTRRRLLVGTVAVSNVGIDLDDKHGDFPRFEYVSPDYRFIPIYQSMGRVARSSTRSRPTAIVVYGASAPNGAQGARVAAGAGRAVGRAPGAGMIPGVGMMPGVGMTPGAPGVTEIAIVDSLARKTMVADSYVVGQDRPPFPGELPAWYE